MIIKNSTIEDDLSDIPFFSQMHQAERDILLKSTTIKRYAKRYSLFLQGDKVEKFLVVVQGWVKLYNLMDSGEEIFIDMLPPGHVLGASAIFSAKTYPFSASIAEDTVLAEIPVSVIEKRVWANQTLARQIMAIMTQKINHLWIENGHLSTMTGEQLLSCLLLRLSSWMTGNGGTFSLPYDKSIMAAQLGVELSTLSRLFAKMKAKGVDCKGSEIKVADFSELSACCCPQCPISKEQCAGRRAPMTSAFVMDFEDDLKKTG